VKTAVFSDFPFYACLPRSPDSPRSSGTMTPCLGLLLPRSFLGAWPDMPLESTKRSQALHADGWHDMHLHVRLELGESPHSERHDPDMARTRSWHGVIDL
jgi:hypothetical protein